MTFEIEHKLPPLEVRLQKPEHHRTIYVMNPQLINYDVFPMDEVPDTGHVKRRLAGYPRKGTLLDYPKNPDDARIYRHSDVADRPDLFGDFYFKFKNPPRTFPDCFEYKQGALVSQLFKDAIEAIDPEGGHQFMPCKIYAPDGSERSDMEYYHFLCGRIVFLPDEQKRKDLLRGNVSYVYVEDIFDSLERARFLSTLPIWCDLAADFPMYFSQEFW